MNYYPFHIGDYASATRHLSWEEDLAFRRLLDVYYTTEKPIPTELRAACRLVMATTEQQRAAVEVVLTEFFEHTDEGWINRRADEEILAMREKQNKQRDKANKRWNMQRSERGTASAMPQHPDANAAASKSDADAMPPTPTPTPKKEKSADALTVATLVLDGLTEQTATEFLAHRRAKGAKLTARAWEGFKAEASKAQWPVEQAVVKALARGWTGFEAAWVKSEPVGAAGSDIFAGAR